MGTGRATALALVLATTTVTGARAQDLYVLAGTAVNSREPGWTPSPATPSAPAASNVPSITGGLGIWLRDDVAVEGSLAMTGAQSIVWHYGYQFGGNADKVTEDRDLPLLGAFRLAPMRHKTASVEAVLGGGITFHRGRTFTTADCGSGSRPVPCVPVSPPRPDKTQMTTADWIATFGADVAIRAGSRVSIAPGFRANFAKRQTFMTRYDHRGPYSGGGHLWSIGVTVCYSIHADASPSAPPR